MKSIISRMGEMKAGNTVDESGDFIDASATETALKSVGVALRDSKGEFRDLDDVLMELGAKWSTLDSSTQRYLGTVIAGNRQQSRFLALMENYDRLVEVQAAAMNSEDAGLLQYSKTLDSLETKLNQVSNNFQTFYMSVFNGEFFKNFIDIINNVITNISRLGPALGTINLLQLINQIKLIGQLLVNSFSGSISKVQKSRKEWETAFTNGGWKSVGEQIGSKIAAGISTAIAGAVKESLTGATNTSVGGASSAAGNFLAQNQVGSEGYASRGMAVMAQYQTQANTILNDPNATSAQQQWAQTVSQSCAQVEQTAAKAAQAGETIADGAVEAGLQQVKAADRAAATAGTQLNNGATNAGNAMQTGGEQGGAAVKSGGEQAAAALKGASGGNPGSDSGGLWDKIKSLFSDKAKVGQIAMGIGTAASTIGMTLDQSTMSGYDWSTGLQLGGGLLSGGAQLFTGNIAGGITTLFTTITTSISRFSQRAAVELENAEKALETAKIERAEKNSEAKNLESTITNLEKLQKARYDSAEAEQEYLDACNQAVETFPSLATTVDSAGNTIVDTINNAESAERLLTEARKEAADAAYAAAAAELKVNQLALQQAEDEEDKVREQFEKQVENLESDSFYSQAVLGALGFVRKDNRSEIDWGAWNKKTEGLSDEEIMMYLYEKGVDFDDGEAKESLYNRMGDFLKKQFDLDVPRYEADNYNSVLHLLKSKMERLSADTTAARTKVGSSQKASVRAYLNTFEELYDIDPEESWGQLEEAKQVFQDSVIGSVGYSSLSYDSEGELTAESKQTINKAYTTLTNSFDNFISEMSSARIDQFNSLIERGQRGSIGLQEFQNELEKFGNISFKHFHDGKNIGVKAEGDAALKAYYDDYVSNAIYDFYRLGQSFTQGNLEIPSYEDWLIKEGNLSDTSENREIYFQRLLGKIEKADKGLYNYLVQLDTNTVESYVEAHNANKELTDNKSAGHRTAAKRNKALDKAMKYLTSDTFQSLDEEAQNEITAALFKNQGTYSWAETLTNLFKQYNIAIKDVFGRVDNLEDLAYENLNTRVNNLTEKAEKVQDNVKDLASKQSSGFTYAQTKGIMKSLEQLGDTSSWDDIFEFDASGNIKLKDFTKIANKLYNQVGEDLAGVRQIYDDATRVLGENGHTGAKLLVSSAIQNYNDSTWDEDDVRQYLQKWLHHYDLDEATIESIITGIASGAIKSVDDIKKYLEDQLEDAVKANEITTKMTRNQTADQSFDDLIAQYTNKTSTSSLLGASTSLSSLKDIVTAYVAAKSDLYSSADEKAISAVLNEMQGAYIDALGNLIITDTQAYSDWILGMAEGSGYITFEGDGEKLFKLYQTPTILSNQQTREDNLVNGLSGVYEDILTDGKASSDNLTKLLSGIKSLGADYEDKLMKADVTQELILENPLEALQKMLQIVESSNVGQEIAPEITASIRDTYTSVLKTFNTSLENAAKGTLTNESAVSLLDWLGIGGENIDKYFTQTIDGLHADASSLLSLIGNYNDKIGNSEVSAKQIATYLDETGDSTQVLATIDKELKKLEDSQGNVLKGCEEWHRQLLLIKDAYNQIADTSKFNFMDEDPFNGLADNLENITDSMESAISSLKSAFEKDGKINYKDFTQIFNWLRDYGGEDFTSYLTSIGQDLDSFYKTVADTIDFAGDLDLSAAFKKMGTSLEGFGGQMGKAFKSIASEQADYWEATADMLDKMAVLSEALGNTTIPMPAIDTTDNPIEAQSYLDSVYSAIEKATGILLSDEDKKKIEIGLKLDIKDGLQQSEIDSLQQLIDAINTGDVEKLEAIFAGLSNILYTRQGEGSTSTVDELDNISSSTATVGEQADETSEKLNKVLTQGSTISSSAISTLSNKLSVASGFASQLSTNLGKVAAAIGKIPKETIIKITTETNGGGGGSGRSLNNDGPSSTTKVSNADYAGTVNNLGKALVNGNAGKTLVGELGPELAVYNDQYHLLGAAGAEFVKLPKKAIVFNHVQTEGILKGQAGYRGTALANGNVGPALADGSSLAAAASQARQIAQLWRSLADASLGDLLNKSGGGGGGNSLKAVTAELQEWYNLLRQIENISQKISNLEAERENIPTEDGSTYLKNLRKTQGLLNSQVTTQKTLLKYQQLQLDRQAEQINSHSIWGKFLKVDENGLLQYINGNETNGGKGALEVLQDFNKMTAQEQQDYLNKIGYTYTSRDTGKALTGQELAQQFITEFQKQIDDYDELYDTVNETSETISELESSVNEIEQEIHDNQIQLEQDIYDAIVESWEKEISILEDQKKLTEEANKAYVEGLNEALSAEKERYQDNESLEERQSLQRQLSLLRRSGGSASEIAELEKKLDSALQDEYFNRQEDMISSIEEANELQVKKLDEQITLQQEALEYQKENGVLWTKVYEIMSGSAESILSFLQGHSTEFFSQSTLQQHDMLVQWAHEIGIYDENRKFESYKSEGSTNYWSSGKVWQGNNLGGLTSFWNSLSSETQDIYKENYLANYANARLEGKTEEEAAYSAGEELRKSLQDAYSAKEAEKNPPNTETPGAGGSDGGSNSGSGGSSSSTKYSTVSITVKAGNTGGSPKASATSVKAGGSVTISPNPKTGYAFDYLTHNGIKKTGTTLKATGAVKTINVLVYYKAASVSNPGGKGGANPVDKIAQKAYSTGGLVDYTGTAAVHGTVSRPEAFLNAEQTARIQEALAVSGRNGIMSVLQNSIDALNLTLKHTPETTASSWTVSPGAVVINVDSLNDSYDVEQLSNDVMNRMVQIASKATNRGVNRR